VNRAGLIASAAVVAVAAAVVASGPAAAAGRLTEHLGALPDGSPAPAGPWVGVNWGGLSGGEFGVALPDGVPLNWTQTATLGPPAGLSFAAATADRRYAAPVMAHLHQPGFTTSFEHVGWPYQTVGCVGQEWIPCFQGSSGIGTVSVTAPGTLSLRAECNAMSGSDPNPRCVSGAYWFITRLVLAVDDAADPVADATPGTPLLSGAWLTGAAQELELTASDVGSGVYRAFWREGSSTTYVPLDPASATCRDAVAGGSAYEFVATSSSLVPCQTALQVYTPTFDLTAAGDGVHTVSFGVEDASGREALLAVDQVVRVNAPGGTLGDPGAACTNGTYDVAGTCIARPPTVASAPVLSGTPTVDGSLTTDDGTWVDGIGATFAYSWELCDAGGGGCTPVPGAHAATLPLTAAMADHTVRSVVTATTNGGSVAVRSAPSYAITGASGGGAEGAGGVRDVVAPPGGSGGGGGGGSPRAKSPLPVPPIVVSVARPNGHGAEGSARVSAERRGGEIVGRLTTSAGPPIADAQVDVVVQAAQRGAHGQIAGAVWTDDDGRFTFRPTGHGGRIFTFGYREHLSDDHYAHWVSVSIADDPAAPTLTVDRAQVANGQTVVFRGTALDPVDLQVLTRGRWTTIASPRPRAGAFSHRYRFTRTRQTRTYRFRAATRSGTSTTATVRVTAKEPR